MDHLNSRRKFLKKSAHVISSMVGANIFFTNCNSNHTSREIDASKKEIGNSCGDFSGVSDNDIEARKKFNYVEVGPLKNKTCVICNLYIPQKTGSECGGCMLFKGPVRPTGSCTYWTQKVN
jgi:hypothetical protein